MMIGTVWQPVADTAAGAGELRIHISNHKQEAVRELGRHMAFENSRATPSDILPLAGPHPLIPPKQHHHWETNVQMPKTMVGLHIQNTTVRFILFLLLLIHLQEYHCPVLSPIFKTWFLGMLYSVVFGDTMAAKPR